MTVPSFVPKCPDCWVPMLETVPGMWRCPYAIAAEAAKQRGAPLCVNGTRTHDFKGQPVCECGWTGIAPPVAAS